MKNENKTKDAKVESKSVKKGFKMNWKAVVITVLAIAVIAIGSFAYVQFNGLNKALSTANKNLESKTSDLNSLQNALSQTEEGRKQLEAANQQLDKKADAAEKEADKANSQLDQANKDLQTQQAKLAQVNAQLAKAKRGIALFDSASAYYNEFVSWTGKCISYIVTIQDAQYNGDDATANYYLGLLETGITKVNYYDGKLNGIFSKLKSGNY